MFIATFRILLQGVWRFLASVQLAVALIATLAGVLACATLLEAGAGRDYVQWYIYHSDWFLTLLALLAVNVLMAMVVRFPWKLRQSGFVITHSGLLVLLGGAMVTFFSGIEGQLSLGEGETAGTIQLVDHSQLTVRWAGSSPRADRLPAAFIFAAGPVDWPDARRLDMGELSGVHLAMRKFIRHARTHEEWVADEAAEGAAVELTTVGPDGAAIHHDWLVADAFGGNLALGSAQVQLQRIAADSLLDDFLKPPAGDVDKAGVLSMHYQGGMFRAAVGPNLGKKLTVGTSDVKVEIVRYLPNAKAEHGGAFNSQGSDPLNPMLELRVHLPGSKEPIRQNVFARNPTLSFDAVHGTACPVKFWYHHPAVVREAGVEFMQTPAGKLFYRLNGTEAIPRGGPCKAGDRLPLAGQFQISIDQHLPHARQQVTFAPDASRSEETDLLEPAALVEVSAGGTRAEVWLKRNDPEYDTQPIITGEGPLTITFGNERLPLGFALKLLAFQRELNPGGMGDAAFASSVQLLDKDQNLNEHREISMNQPLVHRGFTFYQSSFSGGDDGQQTSRFTVAIDPGLYVKYLGSVMICGGTLLMFCTRAWSRRNQEKGGRLKDE